jgi:hypothetical protein
MLYKDGVLCKFNLIFLYKKCYYKVKQKNVILMRDLFKIFIINDLYNFLSLFVDVLCG